MYKIYSTIILPKKNLFYPFIIKRDGSTEIISPCVRVTLGVNVVEN